MERPWGVVLELCFPEYQAVGGWEAFRDAPLVKAALDAVPDPVNGLLMYPGRGGSSGARKPRKPKPAPSAAAAALPEPEVREEVIDLAATALLPTAPAESVVYPARVA